MMRKMGGSVRDRGEREQQDFSNSYDQNNGPEPLVEMERVTGVEPVSLAWEARVIPIYDTRMGLHSRALILLEARCFYEATKPS